MQALVELDLEHNQVEEVPDSVANMPRLKACTSGTERVQGTRLTSALGRMY